MIDLNYDKKLTPHELGAWFRANEYSICHPFKNQIVKTLKKREWEILLPLFKFFDADAD